MSFNVVVRRVLLNPEIEGDFYSLKFLFRRVYETNRLDIELTLDNIDELRLLRKASPEQSEELNILIKELHHGHVIHISEE